MSYTSQTEAGLKSLLMDLLEQKPLGFVWGFMPYESEKEITIAKGMIGRTRIQNHPPLVVPVDHTFSLKHLLLDYEQPIRPTTWYHVFVIWDDEGNYDFRATRFVHWSDTQHPGNDRYMRFPYYRHIASYLTDAFGKVRRANTDELPFAWTPPEALASPPKAWTPYTNAKPEGSFNTPEMGDRTLELEVS
jgi:hypothetical protein